MTTVKSPTIFESSTDTRMGGPRENAPASAFPDDRPVETAPETNSEHLAALLRACFEEGAGRYVELDTDGLDELSIEPFLYRLLGVGDATELLLGVSVANHNDLAYCRAEYGEPQYQVTLRTDASSVLSWDIWLVPATSLWSGSLAGASLVLPARDPGWVILTHPAHGNPWLFPTHT